MDFSVGMKRQPVGVRIFLLGEFRVVRGAQRVPDHLWQRRSAKTLIKMLATAPGQRLHREQIQELIWPDLSPDSAANGLRKALHLARHALEPERSLRGASTYLPVRDDVALLSSDHVWIDAVEFQTRGTAALALGDRTELEQAIALYRGELLPEDRYEDWSNASRTATTDLHINLLHELAALHERHGRYAAAGDCLGQVVALDPVREYTHRQIMRIFALSGQRHQALRQYQACRVALHEHLDAEPDPVTELLYQDIQTGKFAALPVDLPELATTIPMPIPAPVRRLAAGPLIGREGLSARLAEAWHQAVDGSGGAFLVGGETGVGKSRLVAEMARTVADRNGFVLWGTCYEQEGRLPYGPFVEAIDRTGLALATNDRRRLAASYPEFADLTPSLAPDAAANSTIDSGSSARDRARFFAAAAGLLDDVRGDRPLLLVLDDLHVADTATIQLLHHVSRSAEERPWLILGCYREEDVASGSEFQRFRATSVRGGLCHRLDLERLNRVDCGQLLAELLPGGDVGKAVRHDIFNRSLGNPLFIHELVRTMRQESTLTLHSGHWVASGDYPSGLSRHLRDLISVRVERLGDDVQRTVALIATAGETCSFQVLRDTGVLDDSSLLDALDVALSAQVLEEQDTGYGFRHPLVRATLYERLTTPRRIQLHAAMATAIERQFRDHGSADQIESIAHHWAAAGEITRAVPYLVQAAESAARVFANEDAVARLERALALLNGQVATPLNPAPPRAPILERLGDLQALLGASARAHDAFEMASHERGLDHLTTARLRRKAAQQALAGGDLEAASRLLERAGADLGEERSAAAVIERARILTTRSQADFLLHQFSRSLAAAEEGLRLAEVASSPPDVAQASEMAAMACLTLGQWRRGMEYEKIQPGLTDLNEFIRGVADIHLCLGEYYIHREPDRAVDAANTFVRALAASEQAGAPRSLALCHYYLGYAAYFRGRFDEAMSHLTAAIENYRHIESASGLAISLMMRGVTRTALGGLSEGRLDLDRGLTAAEGATLRSHAKVRLFAALGRNRLDANDLAGARRYSEMGLALTDEPSTCICYAAILPVASFAFSLTGDRERGAELAQQALAQARAIDSPVFLGWSHQAAALVKTISGDWAGALGALDRARHLADVHDFPYERSRTILLRAFVHMQRRQLHDLAAATALAAEASSGLVRLGVRASAAQARSSLGFIRGQLSNRPHPTPATG